MKFIATLCVLAGAVSAINLAVDATVDATVNTSVEAAIAVEAAAEAEIGQAGPIVPENYEYAVHDFNLESPFTDQECYQKQVDIYSDQIIAIEALRLEVLQLTQRMGQAEHEFEMNALSIAENKQKISYNSRSALDNKAKIDVLYLDVSDVGTCLGRQWVEQASLRAVLELYCHQFTYVAHLPYQCEAILGAGTGLHPVYAWPNGDHY